MSEQSLIGTVAAPALHVMGWNIRRRMPSLLSRRADRWDVRGPRIRALLREEQPTLLGAQEALPGQVDFLRDCLGSNHRVIGHGRDRKGGGEASPIYYDDRRLELMDWAQRALSGSPDDPGSVSWGNLIPRVMVSATFRDRATGGRFLAVNTHLDHLSRRSRVRSAQAIRRLVSDSGLPAVVTGDFNDGSGSTPHGVLLAGGDLVDAWETAHSHDTDAWSTFPNYREPRRDGRRIDWILVSPTIQVPRMAINPRRYQGGWASDHLPVQAVVLPPENGAVR